MDTQGPGHCCTGACLQALYPLVLPASHSCLHLCSWMKPDCNCPWLLPENTLSPGRWSWVGKGEHGVVPAALLTTSGDRSCGGDGQSCSAWPPWPRCGDGQTCRWTAGHPGFPLSGCSFPCLKSPPRTSGPRGQGRGGAKGWHEPAGGPARSGSWEGPVQRTVSLVIVIRVILQQLESCFCAGVAWLYGSEGGERNTGNSSDGSRIISWRERRAADATEGNKDGDSEGLMHGLALETARTSCLSPSLRHSSCPSGTLCLRLPQPEPPALSSEVQGVLGEPKVGRGGSRKPALMFLAWRSPGESNPGRRPLSRPWLLELQLAWRSEGGRGNRAACSGGVGASLAAVSKLSPHHPEMSGGEAVPVPCAHNRPSVPQAQMETLSKKARGPGRRSHPGPGGACKSLPCKSHDLPLSMSPSMASFRSRGSSCALPLLKVWVSTPKGSSLAPTPHPRKRPASMGHLPAQVWGRKSALLMWDKAPGLPAHGPLGRRCPSQAGLGELAKPWPCVAVESNDSGHSLLLDTLVSRKFPPSHPCIPNSKKRPRTTAACNEDPPFLCYRGQHSHLGP